MEVKKLKPKIFARIFSDSGLHVCDTEPDEVEKICEFVDLINGRVDKPMALTIYDGDILIVGAFGKLFARIKMIQDRDMVIFMRESITKRRGLRAVSQVQGGMRYDIANPD